MQLLHIIATPRAHYSNTLHISNAFIDGLRAKHHDVHVDVLDLFERFACGSRRQY